MYRHAGNHLFCFEAASLFPCTAFLPGGFVQGLKLPGITC